MVGRSGIGPNEKVLLSGILLPIILAACTADVDSKAFPLRQSSIGGALPRMKPVADLGGIGPDGRSLLLMPTAVARIGETIAVADLQGFAVRIFDTQGRLLRSVGRQGSGPAEFRGPSILHVCDAESFFVEDVELNRITVLDSKGNVTREFRRPLFVHSSTCSRSGVLAMQTYPWGESGPGEGEVWYAPIRLMNAYGEAIGVIDSVRLGQGLPLAAQTTIAASDERLYVGTADSPYVHSYSLTGEPIRRIETGLPLRATSTAAKEAFVDEMLSGFFRDNPEMLASERRRWLNSPMPRTLPAYRQILAAPNGTLWLDVTAPGDTTTWLRAFYADGTLLGDAHLPVIVRPVAVDDEYLFVRYDDEAGEPHIALYPVSIVHQGGSAQIRSDVRH